MGRGQLFCTLDQSASSLQWTGGRVHNQPTQRRTKTHMQFDPPHTSDQHPDPPPPPPLKQPQECSGAPPAAVGSVDPEVFGTTKPHCGSLGVEPTPLILVKWTPPPRPKPSRSE